MDVRRLKSPETDLFLQQLVQANNKETSAPHITATINR